MSNLGARGECNPLLWKFSHINLWADLKLDIENCAIVLIDLK